MGIIPGMLRPGPIAYKAYQLEEQSRAKKQPTSVPGLNTRSSVL